MDRGRVSFLPFFLHCYTNCKVQAHSIYGYCHSVLVCLWVSTYDINCILHVCVCVCVYSVGAHVCEYVSRFHFISVNCNPVPITYSSE